VAEQAVDVAELLGRGFGGGQEPEAGVAGRAPFREDLAPAVLRQPDPAGQRVRAEVVDRVQLSELLAVGVDELRGLAAPLVVLGREERLALLLMALEAGLRALVVLEVLPVVGLLTCVGAGHGRRPRRCCERQEDGGQEAGGPTDRQEICSHDAPPAQKRAIRLKESFEA
jgi:hypothetical protein